jgi:hypothetical protein
MTLIILGILVSPQGRTPANVAYALTTLSFMTASSQAESAVTASTEAAAAMTAETMVK